MADTRKFAAIWDGEETFASRAGGRWLVGGDVAPGGDDVLILLEKDNRPAWFKLRGNRVVFDDWEG